jgi:hypothetical protein
LLKFIKEEKLNKRGQTVKRKEKFHGELQIRQKKFCVVHLLFFSLLCSLFSLCNFNFSQIIHFFNISIPKFQTGKTKLPTKDEGKKNLANNYFLVMKLIVLSDNKFHLMK